MCHNTSNLLLTIQYPWGKLTFIYSAELLDKWEKISKRDEAREKSSLCFNITTCIYR